MGLLFARRVTGPLASLNAAARRVASGDLSTLVEIRSNDEIAELSVSFNTMTEELRRLEEAKKRIIADAAHELRTPVTLLQGTVEAMIDGVYPLDISTLRSMHEETIRLSRLIDSLRELETIESGELELDLKEVDVLEIATKGGLPLYGAGKLQGDRALDRRGRFGKGRDSSPIAFASARSSTTSSRTPSSTAPGQRSVSVRVSVRRRGRGIGLHRGRGLGPRHPRG